MKIRLTFALTLLASLAGCTTMMQPVASGSAPKNAMAIGVGKGKAEGDYIFGLRAGDESANRAIENALKGSKADDITNVVIDRWADCYFWIFCHVTTTVRGTLIKYLPDPSMGIKEFGDFGKQEMPGKDAEKELLSK